MLEREELPTAQIGTHFRQLGDQLGKLVNDHVELARAELKQTVAKAGRDVALTAVGVLLLSIGYALLAVGASLALGEVVGRARGFLLVSAFHVVVGLTLVMVFARRLQRQDKPALPTTTAALADDGRFARRLKTQLTQNRS